jgi:hypothetical protein
VTALEEIDALLTEIRKREIFWRGIAIGAVGAAVVIGYLARVMAAYGETLAGYSDFLLACSLSIGGIYLMVGIWLLMSERKKGNS